MKKLILIFFTSILAANSLNAYYCEYCGRDAYICGEDAYFDYNHDMEGCYSLAMEQMGPCVFAANINLTWALNRCKRTRTKCLNGCTN